MNKFLLSLVSLLSFSPGLTRAGGVEMKCAGPSDKSRYHLFNPVPEAQMRDFDSDRPDKTNSAYTLDAGHFQLEMDLVSYAHDRINADHTPKTEDTWLYGNLNLRIGLTNFADLQLFYSPIIRDRVHDRSSGETEHASGSGDFTIAAKLNAWGNDGGDTSGGVELYVKTPTASHGLGNGKTEGGAILLWGISLPADFDLGVNSGVGIDLNDSGSGYHADLSESVSVSHSVVGPLSAYLEFYASFDPKHTAEWEGTVDTGLTCMIGKNFQLDAGVNFGVTRAAADVQTFVGVSVRY